MYKGIDEFKESIRNHFKNKISDYKFDNIFHMSDNENEYYILSSIIDEYLLLDKKREKGRITLSSNDFKLTVDRSERKKYRFNSWIFKEIRKGSYEDYCELFCEEVFRRFNLYPSFYDLAILNNKRGVITYDFIKYKKYISAKDLIAEIINSNNINDIMKYNNYNSLVNIIFEYCRKYNLNINNLDSQLNRIKKMMIIDIILLQSDRNPNNYGFMVSDKLELSRVFDNSNAMSSNHIDRNPYINRPLLTVNNSSDCYYEELQKNKDFYREIIMYTNYIEDNIEDIFISMENKISYKIPATVKKYIKNIIKNNIDKIKKHNIELVKKK